MTIKLYIYGCQTCGINAIYVRKLRAYCLQNGINLEVNNTKYDDTARSKHASLLSEVSPSRDTYTPIVVTNGSAVLLRDWRP